MKTRGYLWWKEMFYSIHSVSIGHDDKCECKHCSAGTWHNVWLTAISGFVYHWFPDFWVWWMNRPKRKDKWLSTMSKWFPNLRKSK